MKNLKMYLTINSLFSGISGLIMILWSGPLNRLFDITNPYIFPVIGLNLVVFSAFTAFVSGKQLHNDKLVRLISALDGLWVLGSFAIVGLGLFGLSETGYWLISAVAVFVGFLGYKQYYYSKL